MIAQMDQLYIKLRPAKSVSRLISYLLFEGRPLTTRGRWINPLVFALFSLEKTLPQLKKVKKPIFIVGTGRSGTTVLGMILSMHRDVGFLNEPKAIWHFIYPYEDLIGNYSKDIAYYRLSERNVNEEMKSLIHRIYGVYLTATFSHRVVDKYPELIFRVPFVKALFPDAKFLFLVRNGWDTCRSIEGWSENMGVVIDGVKHDWWGMNKRKWHLLVNQLIENDPAFSQIQEVVKNFQNHTDMAAVEWILTMREGLSLLGKYPDSVQMVRYEDLTQHSSDILTSIIDFCELPPDDIFFEYATKTLHPTSTRKFFNLHPVIQPLFNETMERMGYAQ
ncbi:MAG: sulfotransferase [Candidatus Jettenia caeni]|nr:MAG: sulfotransferase [Candidatus Jettenia caeni]